jgi:alpha-beta hydrolase superfamily lysophospholipase
MDFAPVTVYLAVVSFSRLVLVLLVVCFSGCGRFAARRMAQAPNTYPAWLAPKAPVTLEFSDKILRVFPNQYVEIPAPQARIRYRIVDPADYQFQWTNHLDEAHGQLDFSFTANISNLAERTNRWSEQPRGTVVLLHGYGVAGFAMLPWALYLAQEGWRCVLVDLRGHGKSTGKQIYFTTQEVRDMTALLDKLERDDRVAKPVSVLGDSYGAVLALRWKLNDARLDKVIAISPYADLSSAVMNISRQYASWVPQFFIKAGLRKLPGLLHVEPNELNPETWISAVSHNEPTTLFVAGGADKIAPLAQVEQLYKLSGPDNKLLVVPNAAHEPLPFYLDNLADPVIRWFSNGAFGRTC